MTVEQLKDARRADRDGEYWNLDTLMRLGVVTDLTAQLHIKERLSADSVTHFRDVGKETRLSALAALMMCSTSTNAVQYFAPRINMPVELDNTVRINELVGKHVVALPLRGGSYHSLYRGDDSPYVETGLVVLDSDGTHIYCPAMRTYSAVIVRELSALLTVGGCLFAHVTNTTTTHGRSVTIFDEPQEDFRDTAARFVKHMNWGRICTPDSLNTAMRQKLR